MKPAGGRKTVATIFNSETSITQLLLNLIWKGSVFALAAASSDYSQDCAMAAKAKVTVR